MKKPDNSPSQTPNKPRPFSWVREAANHQSHYTGQGKGTADKKLPDSFRIIRKPIL